MKCSPKETGYAQGGAEKNLSAEAIVDRKWRYMGQLLRSDC